MGTGHRAQTAERKAHERELHECLNTAIALHQQGHLEQAAKLYQALLNADPRNADALHLLGVLATQTGQPDQAIGLLQQATKLQPTVSQYHFNLGVALQQSGQPSAAAQAYGKALRLTPKDARIAENLAVALVDAGDRAAAMRACERALRLDKHSAVAHKNLGTLLNNAGDSTGARQHFEQLLALHPALPEAHEKLGTVLLRQSDFARGFDEYEWRTSNTEFLTAHPPSFAPYPTWTGDDLGERCILITPEQGVGDEIMFASCYPDLIDQAREVIVQCDPRLQPLLARSFPAARFCTDAPRNVEIDCTLSNASLPRFLRRDASKFDGSPFLVAPPAGVASLRHKLKTHGARLNVGISWRGGADERAHHARSIPLEQWRKLLAMDDVCFVDVQYGDHRVELEHFEKSGGRRPLAVDDVDPLREQDRFAALISALDLVITVDNSTAHLAGALGTPTWLLLNVGGEWRWGEQREDTLWYDSVRLLRASGSSSKPWNGLLKRVHDELASQSPRVVADSTRSLPVAPSAGPTTDTSNPCLLLNDTSNWYHFGCTGTSLALHHQLRQACGAVRGIPIHATLNLAGTPTDIRGFDDAAIFDTFCQQHPALIEQIRASDVVYTNGEGTLHGASPAALSLLYLSYLSATRLGKPTHIVNHSCYPGADHASLYAHVYAAMTQVAVREPRSAAIVRDLGIEVTDSFDSLPLYIDQLYRPRPSQSKPYAIIAGGVTWDESVAPALRGLVQHLRQRNIEVKVLLGARAFAAAEELRFADALLRECGADAQLLPTFNESAWLDAIAGARLLVSGRFHHSIAAAFLGTPLVTADSNTPKIDGLMESLGLSARLSLPTDGSTAQLTRYTNALCAKADAALAEDPSLYVTNQRRAELISKAHANFPPGEIIRQTAPPG